MPRARGHPSCRVVFGGDNPMAKEAEHKFLVANDAWRTNAGQGVRYRQGYLAAEQERSVRVREGGGEATLTIKGKPEGIERLEFEYPIPAEDAQKILKSLSIKPLIEKTRYVVKTHNFKWEIDEYSGENQGLGGRRGRG